MGDTPNQLKAPICCDNCRSKNIALLKSEIKHEDNPTKWIWIYLCHDCNAKVACHPNSFLPMGLMADGFTRSLRKRAHAVFDPIWQSGLKTRARAYEWLADQLVINVGRCHISWLNVAQLKTVIKLSVAYFSENEHIAERRKAKRNDTNKRRRAFENSKIRQRKSKR